MLLLSMVPINFCFVIDTYDTDAIATNKLCKLNFRCILPCILLQVSSRVIRAFLNMVFTFLRL